MIDLEKRLKALPLAKPPADLEETIFGAPPPAAARCRMGILLARPIRLGWALGMALLMAGIGFTSARLGGLADGRESQSAQNEVVVRIVETRTMQHDFDFSSGASDGEAGFLAGDIALDVKNEGAL